MEKFLIHQWHFARNFSLLHIQTDFRAHPAPIQWALGFFHGGRVVEAWSSTFTIFYIWVKLYLYSFFPPPPQTPWLYGTDRVNFTFYNSKFHMNFSMAPCMLYVWTIPSCFTSDPHYGTILDKNTQKTCWRKTGHNWWHLKSKSLDRPAQQMTLCIIRRSCNKSDAFMSISDKHDSLTLQTLGNRFFYAKIQALVPSHTNA